MPPSCVFVPVSFFLFFSFYLPFRDAPQLPQTL